MSPEENKANDRRFAEEVWNKGNMSVVDELIAPNFVLHDPISPTPMQGVEAFKQYIMMYRSAYPDTRFIIEDQVAEGDMAVQRWTAHGTQQGTLMGIPPTGKAVTVAGMT